MYVWKLRATSWKWIKTVIRVSYETQHVMITPGNKTTSNEGMWVCFSGLLHRMGYVFDSQMLISHEGREVESRAFHVSPSFEMQLSSHVDVLCILLIAKNFVSLHSAIHLFELYSKCNTNFEHIAYSSRIIESII